MRIVSVCIVLPYNIALIQSYILLFVCISGRVKAILYCQNVVSIREMWPMITHLFQGGSQYPILFPLLFIWGIDRHISGCLVQFSLLYHFSNSIFSSLSIESISEVSLLFGVDEFPFYSIKSLPCFLSRLGLNRRSLLFSL